MMASSPLQEPPGRRPAVVAGRFYPDEPRALRELVRKLLADAASAASGGGASATSGGNLIKAIIAPHAGYAYSGPIAASAYARLAARHGQVQRVILIGPAHYVPVRGLAASSAASFATPLGDVRVDREALATLCELPQVSVNDQAHAPEHALEVQLPFLIETLGSDFSIVPLLAGQTTADEVAEVFQALWGGPETVIVISSDLSHYHDYASARTLDAATSQAIEALHAEALGESSACGRIAIRGLIALARRHHLQARTIDLRSSGDTAQASALLPAPRDQVVGYGAYVFA